MNDDRRNMNDVRRFICCKEKCCVALRCVRFMLVDVVEFVRFYGKMQNKITGNDAFVRIVHVSNEAYNLFR